MCHWKHAGVTGWSEGKMRKGDKVMKDVQENRKV
jgi:hypothetical protein